jgi:hypothetical protein
MPLKLAKPAATLTGADLHAHYEQAADEAAKAEYEPKLYEGREKLRSANADKQKAERERDEALEGAPKEGSVVLSAEDAAKWEALKGYDPAKLEEEKKEAARIIKARSLEQSAVKAGLNPETFAQFAMTNNLAIEVDAFTEGEGDEAVEQERIVVVTKDGDKTVKTEVAKYLQEKHAPWWAALRAAPADEGGSETPGAGRLPTDGGTEVDPQKAYLARRKKEMAGRQNAFTQGLEPRTEGS